MKSIVAAAAVLFTFAAPTFAQWAKVPDTSLSRTRDGKPNLSARAPKAQDGKPDLSGVWTPELDPKALPPGSTTVESITGFVPPRHFVDITAGMKPEDVSMTPWATDLLNQRQADGERASGRALRASRRAGDFRLSASVQDCPDA